MSIRNSSIHVELVPNENASVSVIPIATTNWLLESWFLAFMSGNKTHQLENHGFQLPYAGQRGQFLVRLTQVREVKWKGTLYKLPKGVISVFFTYPRVEDRNVKWWYYPRSPRTTPRQPTIRLLNESELTGCYSESVQGAHKDDLLKFCDRFRSCENICKDKKKTLYYGAIIKFEPQEMQIVVL